MIQMGRKTEEKIIKIKVHDDEIWEPDKDFHVILCTEEGQQLEGHDTRTTVTIVDEDSPGVLGFEEKHIKVRKMDKYAYVRVIRQNGSAGDIECMVRTETI
jgi:hypothetical protein